MPMPVEGKEVAIGDWSPNYGTVTKITPHDYKGQVENITIEFFNGNSIMVKPDQQIVIEQGGAGIVHNGMPDPSQIRPGLKADHAKD